MGQQERVTALQFDYNDIGRWDDPYPHFARAREQGRVLAGGPGQWVITHYEDVAALLRDARLSHEFPEQYHQAAIGTGPASDFMRRIVLYRDPPVHTILRHALGRVLTRGYVARLRRRVQEITDSLLAPALERGSADLVDGLALPLPILVACELIGVPVEDRTTIRRWGVDLTKAFGVRLEDGDRVAADAAVTRLREYVSAMWRASGARPAAPEDPAAVLFGALAEHPELGQDDVVDNLVFVFFAGFTTTVNLLATGANALLQHPGELARLRADPSLLATAVDEFVRYDGPIPCTSRLVREELAIGDRRLRPGRILHLLLGSANRDPLRFPDPDRLDVGRSPNPHVGFSGGPHYCLGAWLARLEGEVAFGALAARCATLAPGGPPVRVLDPAFRTLGRVPALLAPR